MPRTSKQTPAPTTRRPPAKKPGPHTATPATPSLVGVLRSTGSELTATVKGWADVVRTVPSSLRTPEVLVVEYYGAREATLERRRRRTLDLVAAAGNLRLPRVGVRGATSSRAR